MQEQARSLPSPLAIPPSPSHNREGSEKVQHPPSIIDRERVSVYGQEIARSFEWFSGGAAADFAASVVAFAISVVFVFVLYCICI